MKIKLTILFAILAMTTTACDQKSDIASQAESAGKEVAKKAQDAVQNVKEAQEKAQETVQQLADKTSEVAKEAVEAGKAGVEKSATLAKGAKTATEEALADTITHAQEITKTQTSKSRKSADSAEEEMLKELEAQNKH
jgi:rubrerythrin